MSRKSRSESKSKKQSKIEIEEEYIPREPHPLTDDAIIIRDWSTEGTPRDMIPPSTPNCEFQFEAPSPHGFPIRLPSIDVLRIPFVREKGVKFCIEYFGEYFGCRDYKTNLLQFWFLDIVTDCLWTSQDDFQLPVDLQKVVLKWILYFINLLRDPRKNVTRKEFFETFKEAILVASEVVEEGCEAVPPPEKLISLIEYKEELKSFNSNSSTTSCSSIEITNEDFETTNFVEIGGEHRRKYLLYETTWKYNKHELSSIESFPESQATKSERDPDKKYKKVLKEVEFYKPDLNVPSRFLPLKEDEVLEEESVHEKEDEEKEPMCIIETVFPIDGEEDAEDDWEDLEVKEMSEQFYVNSVGEAFIHEETISESTLSEKEESSLKVVIDGEEVQSIDKCISKKQIMHDLAVQKIWDQRFLDMDDPKKGWIPTGSDVLAVLEPPRELEEVAFEQEQEEEESVSSEESDTSIDDEWINAILNQQKELTADNEDRQVINYGVIRAIIDFMFKYFYESFQFTLIKLAFLGTPDTICQKLNTEWKIPKRIRTELVKPKDPKPVKPPKPKKEKPEKKDKKDKAEKKEKKEKEPKEKKGKPPPLTQEEKEELARLKKEQELREAELRKLEENKRFMFPLDEAATDELFMGIFENWKRVPIRKGKK